MKDTRTNLLAMRVVKKGRTGKNRYDTRIAPYFQVRVFTTPPRDKYLPLDDLRPTFFSPPRNYYLRSAASLDQKSLFYGRILQRLFSIYIQGRPFFKFIIRSSRRGKKCPDRVGRNFYFSLRFYFR